MPEQRLQRCRDAYRIAVDQRLENRRLNMRDRVPLADLDKPWRPSVAYRITQAQRAAEQMVDQSLKDLQAYAGRSSREPL